MNQIENLTSQLGKYFRKDEDFPSCLYLFGQKSVGKSLCLREFLSQSEVWIEYVVVHAIECYTTKILLDIILNGLNKHTPCHENKYQPFAKVDTIEDLLNELSKKDHQKSYLIVIEGAERLRDMEQNILPVFTKLREFTGLNISCILVSHIAFIKYSTQPMITIHVPDYTKNDLIEIFSSGFKDIHSGIIKEIKLCRESSPSKCLPRLEIAETLDLDFYKNFLNIFLNVFYKVSRDLKELKFMASKCYKSYYAPVLSGEIKSTDVTNLWRNISKVFKASLQTGHMRIENLSTAELEEKTTELSHEPPNLNSIKKFAQTLELPNYAKYLLIASFLASHNDAKFDRRLFMKHHGKEKKRANQKAKVRRFTSTEGFFLTL